MFNVRLAVATCMGNSCSPGCRWWCLDGVFCAVLFPTRCLGWDLGLNWVSFWGISYLLSLIRWCNVNPPDPVDIRCQNDVISTSVRNNVASTLIRRHFHAMCPLRLFMHNIGEFEGHQLLSEWPPWYPHWTFVNIYMVRLSIFINST